jgi:hypothetical protein
MRGHGHAFGATALALGCASLLTWPAPLGAVDAATGAAERLTGSWVNVAADQGKARIEAGVEQAIDDLFVLGKPMARSRLREANPPIARLELAVSARSIRVNLGRGRNTAAPPLVWADGKNATGEPIRIRYSLTPDGVLKMESIADGGTARHTFRASDDGRQLRHEVKMESSRLPDDVRYPLEYRRKR